VIDVVIEASLAAGYVVAWTVRKARRATGVLDKIADDAVDEAMGRLDTFVRQKLAGQQVLVDLDQDAAGPAGHIDEVTREQIGLALAAAAKRDETFAQELSQLTAAVKAVHDQATPSQDRRVGVRRDSERDPAVARLPLVSCMPPDC
jgi:hypothetical protein